MWDNIFYNMHGFHCLIIYVFMVYYFIAMIKLCLKYIFLFVRVTE